MGPCDAEDDQDKEAKDVHVLGGRDPKKRARGTFQGLLYIYIYICNYIYMCIWLYMYGYIYA